MTKRKADIFTIAEFVPNWFAARQEHEAPSEESNGTPTHGPGTSYEVWTSIQEVRLPTTETIANWSETGSNTWPPVEGSECTSSWDKANRSEADWAEPHSATWAVANRSEIVTNRSEVAHGSCEPADLARLSTITLANDLDPLAAEEITGVEGLGQGAFWSLLKDAGYEEW